jgi:hypothetical protein
MAFISRSKPLTLMNKFFIISVFFISNSLSINAYSLEQEHPAYQNVVRLITAFKENDHQTIAQLIRYPLKRKYPIPDIANEKEFTNQFYQLFSEKKITQIIASTPKEDWVRIGIGKGVMYDAGSLWLSPLGKIITINYHSKAEVILRQALISQSKKTLHASLQTFEAPVLNWKTKKHHIRVDHLGNNRYRYASWSIKKKTSSKPDLVILNGEVEISRSGNIYTFLNGQYRYRCMVNVLGEGSAPGVISIYKKEKEIAFTKVLNAL